MSIKRITSSCILIRILINIVINYFIIFRKFVSGWAADVVGMGHNQVRLAPIVIRSLLKSRALFLSLIWIVVIERILFGNTISIFVFSFHAKRNPLIYTLIVV